MFKVASCAILVNSSALTYKTGHSWHQVTLKPMQRNPLQDRMDQKRRGACILRKLKCPGEDYVLDHDLCQCINKFMKGRFVPRRKDWESTKTIETTQMVITNLKNTPVQLAQYSN